MSVKQLLQEQLQQLNIMVDKSEPIFALIGLALLAAVAFLCYLLIGFILRHTIGKLVSRSSTHWDDVLYQNGFFRYLAHMIPAVVIQLSAPVLLEEKSLTLAVVSKAALVYLIFSGMMAANALLNTISDIYNASQLARKAPITGFIQVVKLVLAIVALLIIIANLLDRSPILLLSGLGAVTAVLLLVFKDTILGFVAGIQIAANRMVTNGDWIEMTRYGADGTVLEVGLTTVKVQNWDNTITTIPTYALISESFKNWRGMQESAGRRIKRAIYINIQSVGFMDQEGLQKLKKLRFISDYLERKTDELAKYHQDNDITEQDLLNARRLTNIGTYRAYMESYLRHHPQVNQDMTLMVRQLAPTDRGLPLEIYCFCADKNWVNYEKIQADLLDHFFAVLPVFDLRAYQSISDGVTLSKSSG